MILRPAEPRDALEVARVHIRTWQAAYRGIVPDGYLDSLNIEDRAARYDFTGTDVSKPYTILAIADTMIAGFVTTLPSRLADLPEDGEVGALYVSPQHWDRKIGAALIAAGRERLVSQGFAFAYLWLLDGNQRAERFYGIDGWRTDGAKRTDTSRGVALNELRYRRQLIQSVS
jgi:GNAT superfamily N-acetyltransferase